eukprot:XP_014044490.1 PREDICTED: collagen alpha-1(VIII) chain-like [Salmo salar]
MRTFVVLLFVLCSCLSELQVFQSRDNDKKPIFMETTQRVSESQVEEQRDLLQELRAIVAQQSTKLNEMGATVEEQRVLLQELRAIVAQQSTKLNEMGASVEEQRDLLQELRAIVAQQSTKLNEMGATVEELKRENRERPKVAFSASLSESKGPNSDDGILVYKHVFNNIGEAYSPVTGIFRAAVNGVYYFTYTAFTTSSKKRRVSLYKNGLLMVTVTDDVSDSEDGGSNGVTLKLDAGDEVYTRLMAGYYIFDDNNHHSTFTGFLLFT